MAKSKSKFLKKIKKGFKWIGGCSPVQKFIGLLLFLYIKLVILTNRVDIQPFSEDLIKDKKSFFITFWHGRLFGAPVAFYRNKIKGYLPHVVASIHRDGRFIGDAMSLFGVKVIDGSAKKGGVGAGVTIVHKMREENQIIGMTPDSRKPGFKMTKGLIILASETKRPIVMTAFGAKRGKFLKTWDRCLIPGLFTKLVVLISDPIYVPENISGKEIEAFRFKLEKQLLDLTMLADKKAGNKKSPFLRGEIK
ncbi:MAG: DUF374 domain-containing protein [Alphaproteobacteria bacterium]|nr:DUF374 domain-containing protein [Alphaproteobacteria bacterium]